MKTENENATPATPDSPEQPFSTELRKAVSKLIAKLPASPRDEIADARDELIRLGPNATVAHVRALCDAIASVNSDKEIEAARQEVLKAL